MSHTPGPWNANYTKFDCDYVGFHITCKKFGSLHPICETNSKTDQAFSSYEIEANARLIAAAPELLEALQKAKQWHKGDKWRDDSDAKNRYAWQLQMDAIDSAIAKATNA